MSIALENKIVGAAIYKPDLFMKYEFDEEWLIDQKNKDLIRALTECSGRFEEWSELIYRIKQFNPYTTWTEDAIEMLSFKFHEVNNYEKSVEMLKLSHYEEKVRIASERYLSHPTEQNMLLMKDRMREFEELQAPKKNGELTSAVEAFKNQVEHGIPEGIETFEQLTRMLGGSMQGGDYITIAADTGLGKTAFAINLIVEMFKRKKDVAVDMFSLEMTDLQMMKRFVSRLGGINGYHLRDPKNKATVEEKEKAIRIMEKLDKETGLLIHDVESASNLDQIVKQIRRRAHENKGKPYIAIVDYLQLIKPYNTNQREDLQVAEITRTFKLLTNELNIPIIQLAQLNRSSSHRQDKKPTKSDLKGSSSIEQDSNIILFLWQEPREEDRTQPDEMELIISKSREGMLGSIFYRYFGAHMHFEELD